MNQAPLLLNHQQISRDQILIDTRGEADYQKGHIPGAVNIPGNALQDPLSPRGQLKSLEDIEKILGAAGVSPQDWVVAYDDSGLVPSSRLFWVLDQLGHQNKSLLNGGFTHWLGQDGLIEKESCALPEVPYAGKRDRTPLITTEELIAALDKDDHQIIDTRSREEYEGLLETAQRNGHIPGAIHINWEDNIESLFDPRIRHRELLLRFYREKGIDPARKTVVYCRSGARSSMSYFTLRYLGYSPVLNYSGSWLEWGNRQDTPID